MEISLQQQIAAYLSSQGDSLGEKEKFDEAIKKYKDAEKKLRELPESATRKAQIARLKERIGITHGLKNELADYEESAYQLKEAKKLYRALGMQIDCARVGRLLGIAYEKLGKYTTALDNYLDALEKYEKLSHSQLHSAHARAVKWGILRTNRDLIRLIPRFVSDKRVAFKAIKSLKEIQPEFSDQPLTLAEIEYEIGNALLFIGTRAQTQKAIEHFSKAIDILKKSGPESKRSNLQEKIAQTHFSTGKAFSNLKRYSEAIYNFDLALEIFKDQGLTIPAANVNYHKCLIFMAQKPAQLDLAQEELDESYELMEREMMRIKNPEFRRSFRAIYFQVAETFCALSLLKYKETKNPKCLRQALNDYDKMKCRSIAEVLEKEGGKVQGLATQNLILKENALLGKLEQLDNKKQKLRRDLDDGEIFEDDFKNKIRDLEVKLRTTYRKIEELRLEIYSKCEDTGGMTPPKDYDVVESLLELLPQTENCCILAFALLLVAKIKPKESIRVERKIENIPLTNRLIVFLINQNREIEHVVHDIDVEELWKLTTRCQLIYEKIRRGRVRAHKELKALSIELYNKIIPKEIGDSIRKNLEYKKDENRKDEHSHLIVVPDKFLNWVPFDILHDGCDFWGLKYSICTNFSLNLVRLCVRKSITKSQDSEVKPSFFIVQNPLCDLEKTDETVEEIEAILGTRGITPDILRHEKATQKGFVDQVKQKPFSVLHYAGHARMGADPSSSSLELHAPPDKECTFCSKGGKGTHLSDPFYASEFIHTGVKFKHVPVVYLHACESGISEVQPGGDEAYGLTRALFYAGATTIISSRWKVFEPPAKLLAEEFYSNLLKGHTVGIALRNARRIVRKKRVFSRITDWAAFFLQGDPFRKL